MGAFDGGGNHADVPSRTAGGVAFPYKNPQMSLGTVARRPLRAAEVSPGDKRRPVKIILYEKILCFFLFFSNQRPSTAKKKGI